VDIVEEQFECVREKIEEIPKSYPGFVYLPCYYRAGPPCIFFHGKRVRILIKEKRVFNPDGYAYDIDAKGYQDLGVGTYYAAFEFLPGQTFEFEIEGTMMEKKLAPGDAAEEVLELIKSVGVYDLVPLLELRQVMGKESSAVTLRIKKLDPCVNPPLYAHPGDAGMDLCSAEDISLQPGERSMVSTGFAMALPEGYAAFIQPRSGLAARNGISIVNTPGLIDCHYRGEVKVILINLGHEPFMVKRGDRIAQMVIQRVETARVEIVEELDDTARGEGGFGSTGL
jgi:dUTP diphosphatase